jgi:hypothetical protein
MNEIQENLVGKAGVDEPEASHGGRPNGSKNVGRFILRNILLLAGLFLLMVLGFMLMSSLSLEGIQSFREGLQWFNQGFAFVRVCLAGLLIIYWRPFNLWLAQIKGWPDDRLERLLEARWLLLGTFLFVELVLIQRIHELIWNLF